MVPTKMDFIVAFNLNAIVNHGYMKRTSAQVDLNAGFLTESEAPIADEGLIATHAVFMLIAWMLVAPASVFVSTEYMRGEVFIALHFRLTRAFKFLSFFLSPSAAVRSLDCTIYEDTIMAFGCPCFSHGIRWQSNDTFVRTEHFIKYHYCYRAIYFNFG